MGNGINLSMTKSLLDFDGLLDEAIEAVSSKQLSTCEADENDSWKFQVGKYVQTDESDEALFWIGFGWEEDGSYKPCLWLEFDAKTCPANYWEKIKTLVETSGTYFSNVDIEFAQVCMDAWIHFRLKEEHLKRFYSEDTDRNVQKEVLTGFMDEVLSKL